jgi:hypothetical protein
MILDDHEDPQSLQCSRRNLLEKLPVAVPLSKDCSFQTYWCHSYRSQVSLLLEYRKGFPRSDFVISCRNRVNGWKMSMPMPTIYSSDSSINVLGKVQNRVFVILFESIRSLVGLI